MSTPPKPPAAGPEMVPLSPDEYIKTVLETGGSILQFNRIGALIVLTGYRKLGVFECLLWDVRDVALGKPGRVIARPRTLESANGYHFALSTQLWFGPWGEATVSRSESFLDETTALVAELQGDDEDEEDEDD